MSGNKNKDLEWRFLTATRRPTDFKQPSHHMLVSSGLEFVNYVCFFHNCLYTIWATCNHIWSMLFVSNVWSLCLHDTQHEHASGMLNKRASVQPMISYQTYDVFLSSLPRKLNVLNTDSKIPTLS